MLRSCLIYKTGNSPETLGHQVIMKPLAAYPSQQKFYISGYIHSPEHNWVWEVAGLDIFKDQTCQTSHVHKIDLVFSSKIISFCINNIHQ